MRYLFRLDKEGADFVINHIRNLFKLERIQIEINTIKCIKILFWLENENKIMVIDTKTS